MEKHYKENPVITLHFSAAKCSEEGAKSSKHVIKQIFDSS